MGRATPPPSAACAAARRRGWGVAPSEGGEKRALPMPIRLARHSVQTKATPRGGGLQCMLSLPRPLERPHAGSVPTRTPAWNPPTVVGGSPCGGDRRRALQGAAAWTTQADRAGMSDTCRHAGMAEGARGRVTHLAVFPDLHAHVGLRVGTEVVKRRGRGKVARGVRGPRGHGQGLREACTAMQGVRLRTEGR